ncbi:MAG: phospho-N-acetylmuramoyl-pentapeptide-transferase [Planctomycetota bacterium]
MLYVLLDMLRSTLDSVGLPGGLTLYSLFGVLDQLEFRVFAATAGAFIVVLVLGPRVIAKLRLLKIGDAGHTDAAALRKHFESKANVPTMGGVLIAAAIFVCAFLFADIRTPYIYMGLIVLLCTATLGGFDDWLKLTGARRGSTNRQGLYPREKLMFQVGLSVLIGLFAYNRGVGPDDLAHVLNLPFQRTYEPGSWQASESLVYLSRIPYVILAVLMITGMSNAVNITDGMDGLATGLVAAVAAGLVVLTLIAGEQPWAQQLLVPYIRESGELAVLTGAMLGACLGFLWYNCSPAQVFMGDTGSLCLGALIGFVALVIRQEVVVLIMCGVFLAEIGSVVLQVGYFRSTGGKRIFRCAPFHHHLHLGGWREQQVVSRLWIVGILLCIVGLAMLKLR